MNHDSDTQAMTRWLDSPLGPVEVSILVAEDKPAVYQSVAFVPHAELHDVNNISRHALLDLAEELLRKYMAGQRVDFSAMLEHLSDYGTRFQQQVWQSLTKIPYGQTCSYSDIAASIHNPKAVRAVGAANGKNPMAIVVPCHRVIGANGTLTGYAGGLTKKHWLLELEQAQHKLL